MKVKRTPIASAVALALAGVGAVAPAHAQQAAVPPEVSASAPAAAASAPPPAAVAAPAAVDAAKAAQLGSVTVTGIRASLEQSLSRKRNADTHVDVITAEDIGKMPDKNVADSLQRVPGVTISSAGANEGGFDEADRVSMRGTSPSLTQTLINGHTVSSGDWFVLNQTGTVGRSVSYSLLPSELVGHVVVHKSSEASLVEGGVVGSVDIITRKPLEFRKPLTLEASVGAVHATLPNKTDPQLSGLLNWKNEAGTVGVMLQAFSEKRHLRRDGQELLGYEQIKGTTVDANGNTVPTKIAASNPDLVGVWYPKLIGSALFEQVRERKGGLIDVQIKPTNDLSLDFSAFGSHMDAGNYNRNYMLWGSHFIDQGNGQAPDAGYVVRNNTLVSANFSGASGTQYGVYDQISRPDESADSNFFNFDTKWRVNSALVLTSKIGTSSGTGRTPTQDVAEWNTGLGTGGGWALNGVNSAANWNLGSANTASPAGAELGWIFGDQNVKVKDKDKWLQLDGEYAIDMGVLSSLKFGARYADHTRDNWGVIGQGPACKDSSGNTVPFNWAPANYNCPDGTTSPFNPANFPQGVTMYPGNFGSGLGGNFPTAIWTYTPAQLAAYNQLTNRASDGTREDWNSEYGVKEKNSAVYLQGNLEGQGWSGNVGLRLVRTTEHVVSNFAVDPSTPGAVTTSAFGPFAPMATDHSYTDVLPSANLKLDLSKDLVSRFAVSRTMTRPDYSALAGYVTLSPPTVSGGTGEGTGGNPDLKPVRSTNFDASLEWYFAPRSLLSASAFYMDLTSYIGYGHVTKSYMTFDTTRPQGYLADYVLSIPMNTSATVRGLELAYEQPLFRNFGVAVNYTYADAKDADNGPVVGASRNTYNLSAYFENDKFNARLGYNYRSSFFSGLDRSTAFYQAAIGTLAASVGYKVNDNLTISFDARNLNNPTLKYYALNEDQPRSIYTNGRQFYLNARVKF